MRLSHSKLACILSCPMTYHLNYDLGIAKKEEKTALWIGSAVHWGIEHNTEDLSEYFKEHGSFKSRDTYTREQILSEAMVHGYLKHKDELFDTILTDRKTGKKLELLEETHELYVKGKLVSKKYEGISHDFVGIVDLLLLTDEGFIIVDYKTSTLEPDWNNYFEQLYRYIFMLRSEFPDVPIVKIGIINIRKTGIRQKKTENQEQFFNRMKFEYELNDEHYVNYHEYAPEELEQSVIDAYIDNLVKMSDVAQTIVQNSLWYINYAAANGQYGKSDYWDIFYKTPGAEVLYSISDKIWNEETQSYDMRRDCIAIDMQVIEHDKDLMNKYERYAAVRNLFDKDVESCHEQMKLHFICDDELLNKYELTYLHENGGIQ